MKNSIGFPATDEPPCCKMRPHLIRGPSRLGILCCIVLLCACDRSPKPEQTWLIAPEGALAAALTEHFALLATTAGPAELWRLQPKSRLYVWRHSETENNIIDVALSADEQYAITAERNSLAWWRTDDGTLLKVWSLPRINTIRLAADGRFALIGLDDKAIYFSLTHGKTIYAFPHDGPVSTVALSSNGRYALTGSEDRSAKLWDLTNGTLKYNWPHPNELALVALSADARYALTNAALSQTRLWNLADGKRSTDIGPKLLTLASAGFSSNAHYLVTGQLSQRIDLWETRTGRLLKYWRPKKTDDWRPSAANILALTFSNQDRLVTSLAANGYLQRWRR